MWFCGSVHTSFNVKSCTNRSQPHTNWLHGAQLPRPREVTPENLIDIVNAALCTIPTVT